MRYLLVTVLLAAGLCAQNYILKSVVLDDAGLHRLTANDYIGGMSLGQSFASGWLQSTGYRAIIGFWHAPYAGIGIAEQPSWKKAQSALTGLKFRLGPCAPNPLRTETRIHYALAAIGQVRLSVYDRAGRIAGTLVNAQQEPGEYSAAWNVAGVPAEVLPNGVYFLRLEQQADGPSPEVAVSKLVVNR
jgi:hypothetical protein